MSEPIFKAVFGDDWERLPLVMKKHYANHAYRNDRMTCEGMMTVEISRLGKLLSPFFRLAGVLVPYEGENIPVTVDYISTADSDIFQLNRVFYFPGRAPARFHSRMKPLGGSMLVELMRFGLGWQFDCGWNGEKIVLRHRNYVLNFIGLKIPLPIGLLLGKVYSDETPINDSEFSMTMEIRHPLWNRIYAYSGRFRMNDVSGNSK